VQALIVRELGYPEGMSRANWAAAAAGAGFAACVTLVTAFLLLRPAKAPQAQEVVELKPTPGVITAIRDLARLETTSYHVEKVVQATDTQARLWGLVEAKDELLLIAAGDVVAGVDLSKVHEEDVHANPATRSIRLTVPAPEVLSAALDQKSSRVYSRHTDVLAGRREQLEGQARQAAEDQMRGQALDAGILDHARTSAEVTLRALLQALGFEHVEIDWRDSS
jgi:hypothetical protein